MNLTFSKKTILKTTILFSTFLIAAAYFFQHYMGLEPCFLCIVQRICVIGIGISSIFLLIVESYSKNKTYKSILNVFGYLFYFSTALIGLVSASRQIYMQRFPDPYASCGPGYEYILENSSLAKSIPQLFLATGNCSEIDWTFIGFSMAECMIPIFISFIIIGFYLLFKKAD